MKTNLMKSLDRLKCSHPGCEVLAEFEQPRSYCPWHWCSWFAATEPDAEWEQLDAALDLFHEIYAEDGYEIYDFGRPFEFGEPSKFV